MDHLTRNHLQNKCETSDKWPDKLPGVSICALIKLHICNKEKNLMQIA